MPTTCRPHPRPYPRHHPCVSVPYQSHLLGYPATLGHPPQYQQQHFLLLCRCALFGLFTQPFPAYYVLFFSDWSFPSLQNWHTIYTMNACLHDFATRSIYHISSLNHLPRL
ncbi:hypothetical protein LY78DRAFT_855 [Colletotrichum sublineola]|nr:hypothetical protein LY78DRAFT_855 [Colletotrichum sublineola]